MPKKAKKKKSKQPHLHSSSPEDVDASPIADTDSQAETKHSNKDTVSEKERARNLDELRRVARARRMGLGMARGSLRRQDAVCEQKNTLTYQNMIAQQALQQEISTTLSLYDSVRSEYKQSHNRQEQAQNKLRMLSAVQALRRLIISIALPKNRALLLNPTEEVWSLTNTYRNKIAFIYQDLEMYNDAERWFDRSITDGFFTGAMNKIGMLQQHPDLDPDKCKTIATQMAALAIAKTKNITSRSSTEYGNLNRMVSRIVLDYVNSIATTCRTSDEAKAHPSSNLIHLLQQDYSQYLSLLHYLAIARGICECPHLFDQEGAFYWSKSLLDFLDPQHSLLTSSTLSEDLRTFFTADIALDTIKKISHIYVNILLSENRHDLAKQFILKFPILAADCIEFFYAKFDLPTTPPFFLKAIKKSLITAINAHDVKVCHLFLSFAYNPSSLHYHVFSLPEKQQINLLNRIINGEYNNNELLAKAHYLTAKFFNDGLYGFPKDPHQALIHYEKASNLGNADASHDLAFMYTRGQGVSTDLQYALVLLEKAYANAKDKITAGISLVALRYLLIIPSYQQISGNHQLEAHHIEQLNSCLDILTELEQCAPNPQELSRLLHLQVLIYHSLAIGLYTKDMTLILKQRTQSEETVNTVRGAQCTAALRKLYHHVNKYNGLLDVRDYLLAALFLGIFYLTGRHDINKDYNESERYLTYFSDCVLNSDNETLKDFLPQARFFLAIACYAQASLAHDPDNTQELLARASNYHYAAVTTYTEHTELHDIYTHLNSPRLEDKDASNTSIATAEQAFLRQIRECLSDTSIVDQFEFPLGFFHKLGISTPADELHRQIISLLPKESTAATAEESKEQKQGFSVLSDATAESLPVNTSIEEHIEVTYQLTPLIISLSHNIRKFPNLLQQLASYIAQSVHNYSGQGTIFWSRMIACAGKWRIFEVNQALEPILPLLDFTSLDLIELSNTLIAIAQCCFSEDSLRVIQSSYREACRLKIMSHDQADNLQMKNWVSIFHALALLNAKATDNDAELPKLIFDLINTHATNNSLSYNDISRFYHAHCYFSLTSATAENFIISNTYLSREYHRYHTFLQTDNAVHTSHTQQQVQKMIIAPIDPNHICEAFIAAAGRRVDFLLADQRTIIQYNGACEHYIYKQERSAVQIAHPAAKDWLCTATLERAGYRVITISHEEWEAAQTKPQRLQRLQRKCQHVPSSHSSGSTRLFSRQAQPPADQDSIPQPCHGPL